MVYRSATIVFAPARRGARAGERFGFSCSLGCVPVVRDFSTAASPSLEMTRLSTVPQGWRRDEGVPPYRNGKRHSKRVLARGVIPAGGRGTPLPILPKVSTGIADLPAGTSLPSSTCQRLTVIADLPTAHRHCRLANGLPSLPTCHLGAPTKEKRHVILKPSPKVGRWIAEAIAKARRMRGRAKTHEA